MREELRHLHDVGSANGRLPEPGRDAHEEERRRDQREQQVLGHVHGEEVLLAEVVHRRTSGDVDDENAQTEANRLTAFDAPRVGDARTQLVDRVPVKREHSQAEQGDVEMEVPVKPLDAADVVD